MRSWMRNQPKNVLHELQDFDEICDENQPKKVFHELKDFHEIWDEKAKNNNLLQSENQLKVS